MCSAISENPRPIFQQQLGESSVSYRYRTRNHALDLMIDMSTEDQLSQQARPITLLNQLGQCISLNTGSCLSFFSTLIEENLQALNREIESVPATGLRMLITSPHGFASIRKSKPAPEWAGVYVWWNGTVVYNADYINTIFAGDGNFGGQKFDAQYFFEEATHEMLESYESATIFNHDEEMRKHFWRQNLWLMEGLKEAMARRYSGMNDTEFVERYKDILSIYPDFSLAQLSKGFWQYDKSPTHKNIGYQYCGRFLKRFAQEINRRLQTYSGKSSYLPYEGAYLMLNKARERYIAGKRESVLDTIADEIQMTQADIYSLEQQWIAEQLE